MSCDPGVYKQAMRQLAASVTVIAAGAKPHRVGLTATAVCSLTADPPQLLSCLNAGAGTCDAIRRERRFSVNILDRDQVALAECFAGIGNAAFGDDRFDDAEWRDGDLAVQVLSRAVAALECELTDARQVATHFILIGAVSRVHLAEEQCALIYRDGSFGTWVSV